VIAIDGSMGEGGGQVLRSIGVRQVKNVLSTSYSPDK
jgi:RNA 3'-terminal phosphate cyclase